MITVYLSETVSPSAVARVRRLLDDTALRNVDFNGVKFELARGDATWIDAEHYPDQGAANRLFSDVQRIINGEA